MIQDPDRPDVKFVNKKDSRLMRMIGWLLAALHINDKFMTSFWTTIGDTIYYPDGTDPMDQNYGGVREHEYMHIDQFKKYGRFLIDFA